MPTLVARSAELYRGLGYLVESVERILRIPPKKADGKPCPVCSTLCRVEREGSKVSAFRGETWKPLKERVVRQDLYGLADLLASHHSAPIFKPDNVLVQATDTTNVGHHTSDLRELKHDNLVHVLRCGYRFELHGWVNERRRWERPGHRASWRSWWVRILEFTLDEREQLRAQAVEPCHREYWPVWPPARRSTWA